MDEPTNITASARSAPVIAKMTAARTIVVNGRCHEVREGKLTGLDISRLAHPDIDHRMGCGLTVAFDGGPPSARSGLLLPGHSTPITEGQIFRVALTDKS